MKSVINVFVIDDHQVVREGIISLIKENGRFVVLGEAANGKDTLSQIANMDPPPDVLLMDINMPVMDGIECTQEVFKQYGERIKVLALTMVKQSLHIRKMLQAGARGYILKNCDKLELFNAIEALFQGETYFSREVSQEVLQEMTKLKIANKASSVISLSKREQEVLELIVKGLSNKEIAEKLHISIRTVESHKQNLISKTSTTNIAGLVVYAIKHHLVDIS